MEVSKPSEHITHAVIGGGQVMEFGMSDSAEFYHLLSSTLYTDQILAVVREVLCNAWDAHIEAGCTDKPIQITLTDEKLIVRDYGLGIAHDQIQPIYGMYGESTKKKDKRSTGGFGLGCKAPFAYTNHFEVVSHHQGLKTIYNMSKSNSSVVGKPGIIALAQMPTTEQGLRVSIPIQRRDVMRYVELIRRIVRNGEMQAELNNNRLATIPFSKANDGFMFTNSDLLEVDTAINLRYGNVIYPIQPQAEINDLFTKVNRVIKDMVVRGYFLVLQAPPDSIAVTPSRESLSMQEHTIRTLNKLFRNFLKAIQPLHGVLQEENQVLIQETIKEKKVSRLLSPRWVSICDGTLNHKHICSLREMARLYLNDTGLYPANGKFRADDLQYRITKGIEADLLDRSMATTFLREMRHLSSSELATILPNRIRKFHNKWLPRRVLGKLMTRIQDAGLDTHGLMLLTGTNTLTPARYTLHMDLLSCMPFLRKTIVITTAVSSLRTKLDAYGQHNPDTPFTNTYCYRLPSRKAAVVEEALAFFKDQGFEIIDLVKRYDWDQKQEKAPKKKVVFKGLPALSHNYKYKYFDPEAHISRHNAKILEKPEFVWYAPTRMIRGGKFRDIRQKATVGLIKQYGDRVGMAAYKAEYKQAIKLGSQDFMEFLAARVPAVLKNSPTVKEFLAYDPARLNDRSRVVLEGAQLIYRDPDLRDAFGLKNNLTEEEACLLHFFRNSAVLPDTVTKDINQYIESIPLAKENKDVLKAIQDNNDMLSMLSFTHLKEGLKSVKRQTYLEVFLKILKG